MKLCVLENDVIDEVVADRYPSYGALFTDLFRSARPDIEVDVFDAMNMHYPESFDDYDAVLLSGSRCDAFGQDEWVLELKKRTEQLMAEKKKLIGVCFGHQLIALILGAEMGRAPQGWGMGSMSYSWNKESSPIALEGEGFSLLVSHQDQVLTEPKGATIIASSEFCPIAAFTVDDNVICFQGHPEFVEGYSEYVINKRKASLSEEQYNRFLASLELGHDGKKIAKLMCDFVEQ
ncbi:amidotransferase [Dasania marina]|uniref:glutamine amidotransferase-related protein n=1 Tax=Dasania marina TaxID=471499 RepID=UPI0030DC7875|tara:strand:+ start:9259 stop:9960 length:702 start_codon:yes stop_codon:yes gene_type:complete